MKREIRFRAWIKEEKKMCLIKVLTAKGAFCIGAKKGKDTIYAETRMKVVAPEDGRFCLNNEIELMQYTGLHDNNGKEIFEGDIIKDNFNILYTVKYLISTQNKLIISGFYIVDNNNNEFSLDEIIWFGNRIQVVGNIYENPELLKE